MDFDPWPNDLQGDQFVCQKKVRLVAGTWHVAERQGVAWPQVKPAGPRFVSSATRLGSGLGQWTYLQPCALAKFLACDLPFSFWSFRGWEPDPEAHGARLTENPIHKARDGANLHYQPVP